MTAPAKIHVLPDHVINKIAAGEVVERPASVLKELLENALDAGATQIDVEVAEGGRNLVRVADNGGGMARDDALLAIERHATSKINDVDDIENISTMGFRGEALAAIAAVSRFRLCSRPASDLAGVEITLADGKIQDVRETGCPPGTAIEVRNLFFNVPARRKFLRTAVTESAHIRQTFVTTALARPAVGFTLAVDRRTVYNLPAGADLPERVRGIFPHLDFTNLRRVNWSGTGLQVAGYVSLPALSRGDRSEQYVFINGRPAFAPVLYAAVRAGYQGVLPSDRQPLLFLFINLNPGMVDVNVHPTKKEVRFREAGSVRAGVAAAIGKALAHVGTAVAGRDNAESGAAGSREAPDTAGASSGPPPPALPAMRDFLNAMQARPRAGFSAMPPRTVGAALSAIAGTAECPGAPVDSAAQSPAGAGAGEPWSWYRVLGFVGGRYVVLETADGLALLDPHAAHERVLYERFRREFQARQVAAQPLLAAVTIEFSPMDAARIRRHIDLLRRMGFGISEFGADAFMVDALPACAGDVAPAVLLADIVADLEEHGNARGAVDEQILRAACHAAVKAARPLEEKQIEALIEQLIRAEMPYTCPHGRPTLIHISVQELNRKFGRT